MTIDVTQFYAVYFEEADERLKEMERLLVSLHIEHPDLAEVNAIFREAHSIKGGAATFGLNDIAEVTHSLEALLDKLRKQEIALSLAHVNAFLQTKDVLALLINKHKNGISVSDHIVDEVKSILNNLVSSDTHKEHESNVVAATQSTKDYKHFLIRFLELSSTNFMLVQKELSLFGQLLQIADTKDTVFELHTSDSADNIKAVCTFLVDESSIHIEEVPNTAGLVLEEGQGYGFFNQVNALSVEEGAGYGFFTDLPPRKQVTVATETVKPVVQDGSSSIRVNINKVDQLINLVGELVITEAMVGACAEKLDATEYSLLLNRINQLSRNTHALQEAVMSIRMMPIDNVFARFPRMIRDLSTQLGKKVELVTLGSSTELDKSLIERISDPLTHLIRNSIDHGIELPSIRTAQGKNEQGKITLSASQQGGFIVIEVSDDGAGLSRSKILNKAKENNIGVADNANDEDVWKLIFAPGFSTATVVSDVSGRGVGMDVVHRNILDLDGTVQVRSAEGFGTTVTLSVPLTLAIIDGMSIRVGAETYIIPINYIIESVQPANVDINTVENENTVVKIRDRFLPLIRLHKIFNVENAVENVNQGVFVIVEANNMRCALLVDELLGQQQIVVKNLETNFRKVKAVSGATILDDGAVSLILDINYLVKI